MHNEIKIKEGLFYVGASDRRLALFENVYPLPNGASYNSYLYLDEKTCLLDTVDSSVSGVFYDNLNYLLGERKLDYLIVNHLEPDHAANIGELLLRHKETTIVLGAMAKEFLLNYFPTIEAKFIVVKEGDSLSIGKHRFHFVSAPMVHWPEVMFTYEEKDKILFSADAFGTFGALSGNIFCDLTQFEKTHLSEARRYYTNIVGKYGNQVLAVLKKAEGLEIKTIAPLHGPIIEGNLNKIINYYIKWASYTPEESDAVMIAYSSVYGNTKNAADILASKLAEKGVKNLVVYDVSKTDSSYLIAEAWRVGTIVLAATTYNAGVFIKMEDFLHDLEAHKITNRTIAFIENGSWAPSAKANMQRILSSLKGIRYLDETLTITSTLRESQLNDLEKIANAVVNSLPQKQIKSSDEPIDREAMFKCSYGLFLVFTKDKEGKDNASVNNTFFQISDNPSLFALSVNKANLTATTILESGVFNVSTLVENTPYSLIKRFGFVSGREKNKFDDFDGNLGRAKNDILYLKDYSNAFYSLKVKQSIDCGSHILFLAELVEAKTLSNENSLTYAYYFAHTKPSAVVMPKKDGVKKIGWRCKICGYTYVGDTLPENFICPLCKHPASDFEKVEL